MILRCNEVCRTLSAFTNIFELINFIREVHVTSLPESESENEMAQTTEITNILSDASGDDKESVLRILF